MAANKGMVAGSHNRNEFVMIRHDGDAPAPVRPMPPSLPASDSGPSGGSCRARACVGLSVDLGRGVSPSVTLGVRPSIAVASACLCS